jgi:hypothetical protein
MNSLTAGSTGCLKTAGKSSLGFELARLRTLVLAQGFLFLRQSSCALAWRQHQRLLHPAYPRPEHYAPSAGDGGGEGDVDFSFERPVLTTAACALLAMVWGGFSMQGQGRHSSALPSIPPHYAAQMHAARGSPPHRSDIYCHLPRVAKVAGCSRRRMGSHT